MISIRVVDDELKVSGSFDLGYMGIYTDSKIEIYDSIDEIREWDIINSKLDVEKCTDEEIIKFLVDYINKLEKRVKDNIKQINDNFDNAILCSAYDALDECLRFTDWHNF